MATSLAILGGAAIAAGGTIGAAALAPGPPDYSDLAGAQADTAFANQKAVAKADLYNQLAHEATTRAERSRMGTWGLLGEPGTYEQGFETYRKETPVDWKALVNPYKKISASTTVEHPTDPTKSEEVSAEMFALKPGKYIKGITGTRQYRMASYLTAEADQLIRREGPLWRSMHQSVVGGIYEGSAALQRAQMEEISRQTAKSGNARRQGVATVERIRAMERNNRDKTHNLWQAEMSLNLWARENARTQLNFNQAWVGGLPGIRDSAVNAMNSIRDFYGGVVLPTAIGANNTAFDNNLRVATLQEQAKASDTATAELVAGLSNIVGGALMSYSGGGGAAGGTGLGLLNTLESTQSPQLRRALGPQGTSGLFGTPRLRG